MATLTPRMVKDGSWMIVLVHEGGNQEQIGSFTTEEEASAWIDGDAKKWMSQHPGSRKCPDCGGSGARADTRPVRPGAKLEASVCARCGGYGRILD